MNRRGKMKKLVILIAALVLLAAVGGAGWWFFLRGPATSVAGQASADAPSSYVELPAMTVPIIRSDQVGGLVVVRITIVMRGVDDEDERDALLARLTDAFIVELHGLLGRRLMAERGYDTDLMKRRLQRAATRVAGPDRITDVLIEGVEQREAG